MSNILVIGDIYIETQYFVEEIPSINEFSVAENVTTITGSKTINSARILTKLENNVDFLAKVGTDDAYLKVLSDFKHYKINIDLLSQTEQDKTGQLVVITDESGRSSISIYFGANRTISVSEIEGLANDLKKYQMIYAATHLPLDCLYKLAEIAKHQNVPLFLDFPNQQKSVELNKIADVDFISPNRQEAELIFNEEIRSIDDAFRILSLFRKFCKGTIILTLDIEGCAVFEKGARDPLYIQTEPVQAVDATGAGDIFKAVFVSEYLRTKDVVQSVQKAQQVATRSVSIKGVDNTIETLDLSLK